MDQRYQEIRGPAVRQRANGTFMIPRTSFCRTYPANTKPQDIFSPQYRYGSPFPRFVNDNNNREILIYTDGACLNNGQNGAAAGYGFVWCARTNEDQWHGRFASRVEDRGPNNESRPQTSNRAELRAVIAALRYTEWNKDGSNRLVIATDSEYVAKGVTQWIRDWAFNDWRTSGGFAVQNTDLWEELLYSIGRYTNDQQNPMEVCFWRIPREWNREADRMAKEGAHCGRLSYFEDPFDADV